jgi:hypothetical protein
MGIVVSANKARSAGFGFDLRTAAPCIIIGFDLARREAHFDFKPFSESSARSIAFKSHLDVPSKGFGTRPKLTQFENVLGETLQ